MKKSVKYNSADQPCSWLFSYFRLFAKSELSTGRIDPRVGSSRVGLGRVTILPDFGGWGQHFGFLSFSLIVSWYLNRYESSNTAFGLIDFLRYLIYNN